MLPLDNDKKPLGKLEIRFYKERGGYAP